MRYLNKRIPVEKTITEKEIMKVTQVRMSIAYLYLLGKSDCRFGGSFPDFNLAYKENSVHYSLLIDMFGKAEMQVKR